jgi:O-succinylbenzoic acid--CoA ligase
VALIGEERSLTRSELAAEAATGIVAVPARPAFEFVVGVHALWRGGGTIAPYDPAAGPPPLPARSDAASIVFTSGTTAEPRAIELSRANHEAGARALGERLGLGPEDRWLACMPLHHVGGLAIVHRTMLYGSTLVVHEGFDAARVREELASGGITHVSLVPTMLDRLLPLEAPDLQALLLGGGPIPARQLELDLPIVATYGMTETGSAVVVDGDPLPGVELRIADDGEILVRGPMVAADGWLATGDLGQISGGRLTVHGRKADTIITGGENVAPVRVEQALEEHPGVAEAGVTGRPDPEWGEVVLAFVVGDAPEDELLAHARERLARHEVPKEVHRVSGLPRNAGGKLVRSRLESPPR